MKHWKLAGGVLVLAIGLLAQNGTVLSAQRSAIGLYQKIISPVIGKAVTCQFEPSCSHYAQIVLEEQGLIRGNYLIGKRLLMCSPIGALSRWLW